MSDSFWIELTDAIMALYSDTFDKYESNTAILVDSSTVVPRVASLGNCDPSEDT